MFSSATNRVVRKWSPRWLAHIGKNPSHVALNMHLLNAFINSTDVGNSNFASKRTHRQVTFTYAFVGWMLNEGPVYFGMRTNEFRMVNRMKTTLELSGGRLLNLNQTPN